MLLSATNIVNYFYNAKSKNYLIPAKFIKKVELK